MLTFPPEVGILFSEGFGANTSERLAAEKEAALITFFFAHPAGRTGTICHLRRFGSEAYRHRLCSGLWLFCVQDRNGEYGTTAQVITFCGVCPCRWHPPAAAGVHTARRCAYPVY